jgi:poly(hydroxyalkanoate) granule-associated protein
MATKEATQKAKKVAQEIEVMEEEITEVGGNLLEGLRKILLAGIGAVAVAQEEIEDFVNKLIDRGEIAEKDGRKLVTDVMERRRDAMKESTQKATDEIDKRIEGLLERLNLPTRSEIEKLTTKIGELNAKVDELKKQQSK